MLRWHRMMSGCISWISGFSSGKWEVELHVPIYTAARKTEGPLAGLAQRIGCRPVD